jgi:hypothetical protein
LFNIRIDLGVPGEELVVERNPSLHTTLQNVEATGKTKKSEPRRKRKTTSTCEKSARPMRQSGVNREESRSIRHLTPPQALSSAGSTTGLQTIPTGLNSNFCGIPYYLKGGAAESSRRGKPFTLVRGWM